MDLGDAAAARVRATNEAWIRRHGVTAVQLGVNYALAVKPANKPAPEASLPEA